MSLLNPVRGDLRVNDSTEHALVFIVRLWFEPREIDGAESELRGVVEQVATGERRYFRDLKELPDLMTKFFGNKN